MFHHIPAPIIARMRELEELDARDRQDGTPHLQRLRQIPPETGRFLALLLANAPSGTVLEVGTSAGYSSLWLSLACRLRGDHLVTFEKLPEKIRLARETFQKTELDLYVTLVEGDALIHLSAYNQVAFCFMDAEKDLYQPVYEQVVPSLVPGGIFTADNVISHPELASFVEYASKDARLDTVVVPIGKGILVGRKLTAGETR
jgi:caffeoyl-CoA O-methyltransferase